MSKNEIEDSDNTKNKASNELFKTLTNKESKYYNPDKILRMRDLEGLKPAIYIISTNRSAGKTFSFLKKVLEDFKKDGKQFGLIYRHKYELNSSASLFDDVQRLYPELRGTITTVSYANGLFYELIMDEKTMGWSFSMNSPDALKKHSPKFSQIEQMIFDEYHTESGKYLDKEIEKFQSLYLTIARGGGKQSRHVNVYMLGNNVTLMNPYFIKFDIHKRLKTDTKFMRGNGWVAEFGFNESASQEIRSNAFYQAFKDEGYMAYSTENVYLSDASIFVGKISGRSKYLFTILHESTLYGVREYYDKGILYISKQPDNSCKQVITFKASDHNANTMMLSHYSYLWKNIKDAYQKGWLRFDDIQTKNDVFDILGVDLFK
jgi:hypothetical protein